MNQRDCSLLKMTVGTTLLCMLLGAAGSPVTGAEPSHADIVRHAFEQVE